MPDIHVHGRIAPIIRRSLIGLLIAWLVGLPLTARTTISVIISTSTFTFGTQPPNTWLTPQSTVIRNDGDEPEDLMAQISPLTTGGHTWTLSATTNGADSVRAQWSTESDSGSWNDISAYDTDFSVANSLADGDSIDLWFRIQTPASTTSFSEHSATLTVTAVMP